MTDESLRETRKRLCQQHGWTVDEFADKLGISRSQLYKCEQGTRRLSKASRRLLALLLTATAKGIDDVPPVA